MRNGWLMMPRSTEGAFRGILSAEADAADAPGRRAPSALPRKRGATGRTRTALLAAMLALPLGTPAARETDHTQYASLAYAPLGGEPGCLAQGLRSTPPAWTAGGDAALVLTRRGLVDARRGEAVAALLSEGGAVLEIVAGAATDCGGRAAADPRDEVLAALAALVEHGAGPVVVIGFEEDAGAALALGAGTPVGAGGDDLIAFCRPRAWAAEPCFCSVETVEVAITPGEFVLHMRGRRAAGATSAAELRAATGHAREVCGDGPAAASLQALGASPIGAEPPPPPARRTRAAAPARGGAP